MNSQVAYDNPGITPQGEIALRVLNQINDYMDAQ
jgi:hypothetical protein